MFDICTFIPYNRSMSTEEKNEIIRKALEADLWWAEAFAKTALPYGRQDIASQEFARAEKIKQIIAEIDAQTK